MLISFGPGSTLGPLDDLRGPIGPGFGFRVMPLYVAKLPNDQEPTIKIPITQNALSIHIYILTIFHGIFKIPLMIH
jgi:hypothetical protein